VTKKSNLKSRQEELRQFEELLKSFDERDFDGHTEFDKLTAKQKLEWLSELILLVYKAKSCSRK